MNANENSSPCGECKLCLSTTSRRIPRRAPSTGNRACLEAADAWMGATPTCSECGVHATGHTAHSAPVVPLSQYRAELRRRNGR